MSNDTPDDLPSLMERFRKHFPKCSLDVTLAGFVGDLQGRAVVRASVIAPNVEKGHFLAALGSACFTEEGVLEGDYVALAERRAIRSALLRLFSPYTFDGEAEPGKVSLAEPPAALRSTQEATEADSSAEPEDNSEPNPEPTDEPGRLTYWKDQARALFGRIGIDRKFTQGAGFRELVTEFTPQITTKSNDWSAEEWKSLYYALLSAFDRNEWDRLTDFLPGKEKADGGSGA